jgi:hypothetical protein
MCGPKTRLFEPVFSEIKLMAMVRGGTRFLPVRRGPEERIAVTANSRYARHSDRRLRIDLF